MKKKVLVMDTSMLCVWLKVNGLETCGPDSDRWDYDRVKKVIDGEMENQTLFVLPVASIIETGNHIAHANGDKYTMVKALCDIIVKTAEETSPWAAFTEQSHLWTKDGLKNLANRWQKTGVTGQSIGDASIVDVAEFYSQLPNHEVEILTGDEGLKAYQPSKPATARLIPRRKL